VTARAAAAVGQRDGRNGRPPRLFRRGRAIRATAFALFIGASPIVGSLGAVGGPASALVHRQAASGSGTPARLRAKAAEIEAAVAADGAALQRFGEAYLAAMDARDADRARQRRAERAAAALEARARADTTTVRAAAIQAYVSDASASAIGLFLNARADQLDLGEAYLAAETGQLTSAASALSAARLGQLSAARSAHVAARRATAALSSAARERRLALATLSAERHLLATTRGRLAALLAAEAAARARAAALAAARQVARQAAIEAAARVAATRAAARATAARTTAARAAAHAEAEAATRPHHRRAPRQTSAPPLVVSSPPPPASPPVVAGDPIPASLQSAFDAVRNCESGGDYADNTGNGYYGAYQFSLSTWWGLGESGLPSDAAPTVQDGAAYRLYLSSGWASWPACAAIAGLG
jgi:hypothetical protein